ncbi:TIM barrel protein [Corynebacterium sp.]|uniref:TIM barrel protein n=1 Tax=Corynebacterium sp. TaxID=1720 RepID=UPI003B3B85BE
MGAPDLDRAAVSRMRRIELWWPWDTPEPSDGQIDDLVAELRRRRLSLVAVNYWGGDTSAGQRGVLHEQPLSLRHLDAMSRLAEATGADRFNLLVGRGGRQLSPGQLDNIATVSQVAEERGQGTVLIEPSAGVDDYPVVTVAEAMGIVHSVPNTALLADLWHLSQTDDVPGWLGDLADAGTGAGADALPAHVQIADDPGRGAPGTGELPLEEWVGALRAAGYAGDVAGEWMW